MLAENNGRKETDAKIKQRISPIKFSGRFFGRDLLLAAAISSLFSAFICRRHHYFLPPLRFGRLLRFAAAGRKRAKARNKMRLKINGGHNYLLSFPGAIFYFGPPINSRD